MYYWIGHFFWTIMSVIFFPRTLRGLENIPSSGAYILASNHRSNIDPMILGISRPHRLSYMAKDSLFKNKFFGYILAQVGTFPVKRGSADIGAIKEALRRLKGGCPIVIFPEGTRKAVASSGETEVQSGIALIAVKSRVPVVPVFIKDSDKVLPPGGRAMRRHPISIAFGKPKVYLKSDTYPNIASQIMKDIQALSS